MSLRSTWRRLRRWQPEWFPLLLAANLVGFAASLLLSRELHELGAPLGGWGGPGPEALDLLGANVAGRVRQGEWYRLLTCCFLHGGLLHIAMNMIALRNLGLPAQHVLGPRRFIAVYLASGLAGAAASFAWRMNEPFSGPGVGASGAICGLLGFLIGYLRNATDVQGMMIRRQLVFWAFLALGAGLVLPAIDNAAHVGGAVTGFGYAVLQERGRRSRLAELSRSFGLALALVVLTLGSMLWAGVAAYTGPGRTYRAMLALSRPLIAAASAEPLDEDDIATLLEQVRETGRLDFVGSRNEPFLRYLEFRRRQLNHQRTDSAEDERIEAAMRALIAEIRETMPWRVGLISMERR